MSLTMLTLLCEMWGVHTHKNILLTKVICFYRMTSRSGAMTEAYSKVDIEYIFRCNAHKFHLLFETSYY